MTKGCRGVVQGRACGVSGGAEKGDGISMSGTGESGFLRRAKSRLTEVRWFSKSRKERKRLQKDDLESKRAINAKLPQNAPVRQRHCLVETDGYMRLLETRETLLCRQKFVPEHTMAKWRDRKHSDKRAAEACNGCLLGLLIHKNAMWREMLSKAR